MTMPAEEENGTPSGCVLYKEQVFFWYVEHNLKLKVEDILSRPLLLQKQTDNIISRFRKSSISQKETHNFTLLAKHCFCTAAVAIIFLHPTP